MCNELREGSRKAHQKIVVHFRSLCNGEWLQLADNEYARSYLTLHLDEAGQYDELFQLVATNNLWAETRYKVEGDFTGYLADLERAWRWVDGTAAWNVGRQIQCALIKSSIHSLVGNLSPALLRQLIETGLWSAARVLAYIGQIPDEEKRRLALCLVSSLLPAPLVNESAVVARTINDARLRALALTDVLRISACESKPQLIEEVLRTIKAVDSYRRMEVLGTLAPELTSEYVYEALEIAHSIPAGYTRFQAMISLVIVVPEDQRRGYVLELLNSLSDITAEYEQIDVIVQLAAKFPSDVPREALERILAIKDDYLRADGLAQLAQYLPPALKQYVLQESFKLAPRITDVYARVDLLMKLKNAGIASINPEILNSALVSARLIHKPHSRAQVLRMLMTIAPDEMQESIARDAYETAQSITSWGGMAQESMQSYTIRA